MIALFSLGRLLLPLLPYLAAAALLFGGGWAARGVVADRDLSSAALACDAAKDKVSKEADLRVNEARGALADLKTSLAAAAQRDREAGDAAAARLAESARQAQDESRKLKKELRDAQARAAAAGRSACDLSVEWVRLYNAALRAGGDPAAAAGGAADPAGGAGAAGQQSAGVNEWDVADVHAENARRWQSCRSQLNELIDLHGRSAQ